MGKHILSIVVGLLAGVIIIGVMEGVGHYIYPPPSDIDMNDKEALAALIQNAPVGALLMVILAWAIGAFGGGAISARIAKSNQIRNALIVGGILMVAGLMNLIFIPHPIWFWVLGLSVYLPAAYMGGKLAKKG